MNISTKGAWAREISVMVAMVLVLFFWVAPVATLAGLLSYEEIKKTWPWLARMIEAEPRIGAVVQNFLPSVGVITLNACLPFILEGEKEFQHHYCVLKILFAALTYVQGYRARSWIEYSLLKKSVNTSHAMVNPTDYASRYFLFLLINVVFIFLFASTYWQVIRDLANSPAKIPEKLAAALQQGNARLVMTS